MKQSGNSGLLIFALILAVDGLFGESTFGQRMQFPSELPTTTLPDSSALGPSPGVMLDGTIQPVPPECQPPQIGWDPYASPGTQSTPGTLWPNDPNFPATAYGLPTITFATATKFLQEVRIDYLWMPGTASREFGINDVEATATFALPLFSNPETPLLITPGFAVRMWNGPTGLAAMGVDLPGQVYDAYLDAAWNPQITQWLGGELSLRVGVYSDFKKFTSESIRYTGTGLLRVSVTPSFALKGGIWYLDRQRIHLLPAGGVVWTPNSEVRCEIVFPNPKLARHLTTFGTTEWWGYLRGEYGGGTWTIAGLGADGDPIDYNDMRVAVGVDFTTLNRFKGLFEVGVAFERELYHTVMKDYSLNTTVFLRGGLAY